MVFIKQLRRIRAYLACLMGDHLPSRGASWDRVVVRSNCRHCHRAIRIDGKDKLGKARWVVEASQQLGAV